MTGPTQRLVAQIYKIGLNSYYTLAKWQGWSYCRMLL